MTIPSCDRAPTPCVLHHPQRNERPRAAEPRAAVHSDGARGGVAHVEEARDDVVGRDSAVGELQQLSRLCQNRAHRLKSAPCHLLFVLLEKVLCYLIVRPVTVLSTQEKSGNVMKFVNIMNGLRCLGI